MVVLFMFRRTTISVFIPVMPHMADTVINFTALKDLGLALTAGEGGAMAGEDMAGIEAKEDQRIRMAVIFKVKSSSLS